VPHVELHALVRWCSWPCTAASLEAKEKKKEGCRHYEGLFQGLQYQHGVKAHAHMQQGMLPSDELEQGRRMQNKVIQLKTYLNGKTYYAHLGGSGSPPSQWTSTCAALAAWRFSGCKFGSSRPCAG